MTSNARFLAAGLLSIAVAGCGKKEEPPAAVPPPSATPGMMATASPLFSPSPGMTATVTPGTPTMAPATAPTTRPPAAGAASPTTPATRPAQPQATTAAPTAAPPAITQPPATQPAATQPPATRPAAPARPAAQRPAGKITLPAKLGAVTFDHEAHAGKNKIACATCHHASKPQKPLAAENQRCRDCHTMPATAPMKTSLQAAFHDPRGATGTCMDCHKKSVASGQAAPTKCTECHKKK